MKKNKFSALAGAIAIAPLLLASAVATAQEDENIIAVEEFNPNGVVEGEGVLQVYNPISNNMNFLPYQIIDGMAIHEGDIILGEASSSASNTTDGVQRGVVQKTLGSRWDNGIVYYELNTYKTSNTDADRGKILAAMQHIEDSTSIRFVPRTSQTPKPYVFFENGGGCSSYVGRQSSKQSQRISLYHSSRGTCLSRGTITHEIFHALSVFHEQSRIDRNEHVVVHFENIRDGKAGNFTRRSASSAVDIGPYDYGSMMHYSKNSFSKGTDANGRRLPTITTIPENIYIGQRSGLSEGDIKTLQYMYYTDIQLTLDTVTEVEQGGAVQAAITINNSGNDPAIGSIIAKDINVIVPLPTGSSYSGFSSVDSWSCSESGPDIKCNLATLDRNTSSTLLLDFTAPNSGNFMRINATVKASNRDIRPYDNEGTAAITVNDGSVVGVVLTGTRRADELVGGDGNDTLIGRAGNDELYGGAGDDVLHGGRHADVLIGGPGADTLIGGAGIDTFIFEPGDGVDHLVRFRLRHDKIDFTAFGFANLDEVYNLVSETADGYLAFNIGDGDQVILDGIAKSRLKKISFIIN